MNDTQRENQDLSDLFASTHDFDDGDAFEGRVNRGLQVKLWLRQWLVVLAGFTGGIYALAQVVRMPNWTATGKVVYGQGLQQAASDTDNTLRAGSQMVDDLRVQVMGWMDSSAHYLTFMQTPLFFWVSFSLCLAFVGLYYAYSQEETV